MALRKKLHNELVDLKGNIRVFARVRPIISEDGKGDLTKIVVECDPTDDQLLAVRRKGKGVPFEMDHVFTPESKQEDVFAQARDVIVSCIDGFNGKATGANSCRGCLLKRVCEVSKAVEHWKFEWEETRSKGRESSSMGRKEEERKKERRYRFARSSSGCNQVTRCT